VTPPTVRPFEEVRTEVEAAWRRQQRSEAAAETARAVAERLRAGEDMVTVAAETGLSLRQTPPVTRDAQRPDHGAPAPVVSALFALGPGEVSEVAAEDGHYVVRLAEVIAADPAAAEAAADQIRQQLRRSLSGDILAQFSDALRGRYSVDINRRAIETMF
jgi:peptidyl-prolyl cis-trans isomerase D